MGLKLQIPVGFQEDMFGDLSLGADLKVELPRMSLNLLVLGEKLQVLSFLPALDCCNRHGVSGETVS